MIVVTGLRSGTSLMMQTLRIANCQITGFAFHDEFSHKELNPKGYWSLPMNEMINGVSNHRYKGNVVKLGGYSLFKTNPEYVDKTIWCRRSPEECKKSIKKLLKADFDIANIEPTEKNAENIYNSNLYYTKKFLDKNKNTPVLEVYYEAMLLDSKNTIEKIFSFLGIKAQNQLCVDNIIKEKVCQL